MRQGHVFRRCGRCGAKVEDRRCPHCASESFSWAFRIDLAAAGAQRQQRRGSGYKTKAAALAAIAELQVARAAGTHVEPSKMTVAGFLEQWVAGVKVRASTRTSYEAAVRVHSAPRIGKIPLQQLTRNHVKALYAELAESGRARGRSGGGLSEKTVHNVHLALRKAFADAVDDGPLRANPADRAHKLPTDRPEMQVWSAEELRTFLDRVEDDDNRALWRLAASTGMRRGEVLGLRWQDVDLTAARLSVRQQLLRTASGLGFGPPKPKAGRRSIALDQLTVGSLRAQRQRWIDNKMRWGEAFEDLDLVFCRANGSALDPDVVTGQFERATKRAGVKTIRLHDLRHTQATLLLQANVHPKVVQERLGHSSVMVTLDRYSHVSPNMQDEAAAKMGAILGQL
jgi:integrase